MKARPVAPVFAGLLFVLGSSPFLVLGMRGLYRDHLFDGNVDRSTATIERLDRTSSGKGGTTYEAIISFVAGNESVSEDSTVIAPGTFYHLHQGDHVPIKYLPDQPVQVRIEEEGEDDWHRQNDKTGLGVGLFFSTVGFLIACFGRANKGIPRRPDHCP